jgi:large subunit ribosomal protein L7/L12
MDKNQFIESVEKMSVAELNDLVKALEEKFGVSAASFASSAGPAVGAGAGAEEAGEKDSFNVILKDAGASKIQVIKVLREITGLGLKEAKDMTDKPGSTVKEGVKKPDADEMKKKLESAGATVELK